MRYLFIAFLFISSFISGQGIEPTSLQPTQYQGGILKGVTPFVDEFTGDTMYIYQHVDSLVFIKDSIFVRNDSIFLRDGTGFAIVTDSIYLVEGISKDTIKLRDGKGYALISKGGVTNVTATTPVFSSGGTTPNITIQNASTSTTGALTSTDWNTFNNKMYDFGYVTQSGTGAGVISYLTNHQYINFINGSNITISRASGTNNVTISAASSGGTVTSVSSSAGDGISTSVTNSTTTPNISITNTKPFDLIYTQANSGSYGGLYNGNVLNLTGSGGTTVSRSGNTFTISSTTASSNLSFDTESGGYTYLNNTGGSSVYFQEGTGINLVRSASNVLTVNSTVTNTDNQTLSFSSPNLSISGGNSVALPVLPAGSSSNTLRHNGSAWVASSLLANGGTRIDINSWPGTINLGSRLLVNGYIQYNPTGFQATTLAGRDTDGGLTGVTVGSGLSLSSGTVNATDASTTNELQYFSHSPAGSGYTATLTPGATGGSSDRTLWTTDGDKMRISHNGSGIVTLSTIDAFGQMSGGGGCASVSTSWGTTLTGSNLSSGMTASGSTITIPATGTYEINYGGYFIIDTYISCKCKFTSFFL